MLGYAVLSPKHIFFLRLYKNPVCFCHNHIIVAVCILVCRSGGHKILRDWPVSWTDAKTLAERNISHPFLRLRFPRPDHPHHWRTEVFLANHPSTFVTGGQKYCICPLCLSGRSLPVPAFWLLWLQRGVHYVCVHYPVCGCRLGFW